MVDRKRRYRWQGQLRRLMSMLAGCVLEMVVAMMVPQVKKSRERERRKEEKAFSFCFKLSCQHRVEVGGRGMGGSSGYTSGGSNGGRPDYGRERRVPTRFQHCNF